MNSIIKLLGLEDPDIVVLEVTQNKALNTKDIFLAKALRPQYCPVCNFIMHSKGIYKRTVKHPVLQDGWQLILHLNQRRYSCTNPNCNYTCNESFPFVEKHSQRTAVTELLVLNAFRDINSMAAEIARKFNLSDTTVLQIFDRYVDMKPLPLSEVISVDEVHLEIPHQCEYALVIMDFLSGEPIDMLPGRNSKITEPYFAALSPEERNKVRFLISDMHNPYLGFVNKYFPHAEPVIDSFHVIQWLCNKIRDQLNQMLTEYKNRDEQVQKEKREASSVPLRFSMSDEVYLLKYCKWIMLTNPEHLNYNAPSKFNRHFKYLMDTYAYEERFFNAFPFLRDMRDLKDRYILFNQTYEGNPSAAAVELNRLITLYRECDFDVLRDFSRLLKKYRQPIINSFVLMDKRTNSELKARMSNGPIESLNRKPKDQKRNARGFRNFQHARNRFLFATRINAPILSTPKEKTEILNSIGTTREPYQKRKQPEQSELKPMDNKE